MATVYAVASAKGGVGKTTTTAAIATVLAESGADVVAIDADVGMANLADALGMVPGETTIHDVLAGRADPTEAVHDGPAGLRVVPGDPDLDAYAAADPTELGGVVEAFADADYVFLDAGAGLSHDSTLPIGLADETLLVSTPDRSALGDTEKTRQLAERIGGSVAGAAITRVGGDEDGSEGLAGADETADPDGPSVDIVDEILATRVLARIPEDPTVARASAAGEPLSTFDPDAPASRAYRELARTLTGVDVAEPGSAAEKPVADADEADEDAEEDGEADDAAEEAEDAAETDEDADAEDDDSVSEAEDALIGDAEEAEDAEDAGADVSADDAGDADDEELGIDGDEQEPGDEDRTELIGEAETGSGDAADADGDDESGDAGDDEPEDASDVDGDGPHDEDDLEGSVPFRDDDTGTMETALTGADDGDRSTDDEDREDDADDGSRESDGDRKEDDGDDGKRGFFSRLLGR